MSNFLLLGHKGYLGSYICKNFDCDILDHRDIYCNGKNYKYIINCIGKASLEYCQEHLEETNYSNATVILDIIKNYPNSKIINFSSYYVYDDIGFCSEFSNTTDKYNYCKQKLFGEQLNKNGINLRIGKLFGNIESNQNKLTEHIIHSDKLEIDTINFNPTSVQSIVKLLQHESFLESNYGTFNFSNDGFASHYDYAAYILKYLCMNKQLYKIDKKDRCFSNYGNFLMSIDKIKKFMEINSWESDLKQYLDNYK